MDDLLDAESGKHDYDWLLTPPGTPRVPTLDAVEKASSVIVQKPSVIRSSSAHRASRLSTSQLENGQLTRPSRSSSVSRSSVVSNGSKMSVVNSSISSVGSRPSTPGKQTNSLISAKPYTPTRPLPTRSPTPVKTRPSSANSAVGKPVSLQNARPLTPTRPGSTPTSSSTASSLASRSSSRSSTPVRQPRAPTPTRQPRASTPTRQTATASVPAVGRLSSSGQIPTSSSLTSARRASHSGGRNSAPSSAPSSRPSSPSIRPSSPKPRAPVGPLDIPDFPNETPPNLRTKLPERASSAGRSRPGMALSARSTASSEPTPSIVNKKVIPAVSRSKFSDAPSRTSSFSNGHQIKPVDRLLVESESRKPSRSTTGAESTGFGRTISKNSLDMAIRHMDIRQNLGGLRGASVFPHSIRSAASKSRPARVSDPGAPPSNGDAVSSENGSYNGVASVGSNAAPTQNGGSSCNDSPDRRSLVDLDMYGSTRYDTMLMKEDTRNTSWLLGGDDRSDQSSPLFDHRFEALPNPFGPV